MSITKTQVANHAQIDDLPDALEGKVHFVRAGLGITAFGVQVLDVPAGVSTPEHDETSTGQEELYVTMSGSGTVVVEGERFPLDPEHVTRVSPGAQRHLEGGPDGARVLCVGGTSGQAYEPPDWTQPA
jgi:mannose-6-phosphate isomerase-like protein (cupin superfamily)